MPKKTRAIKPLKKATNYEKSTRIVDVVKKCRLSQLSNDITLDVIEFETGKRLTLDELKPIIELAKREVKEQKIQVDMHMDYMVRIGLYEDSMIQHDQLTIVEKMIFGMIIKEGVKPQDIVNQNLILNAANTLTKVMAAKSNTITNIGFLSKTKMILEQGISDNKDEKGTVIVEKRGKEIDKLVDDAIDIQEMEQNRVA
jgi:hypothetical protein